MIRSRYDETSDHEGWTGKDHELKENHAHRIAGASGKSGQNHYQPHRRLNMVYLNEKTDGNSVVRNYYEKHGVHYEPFDKTDTN